MPSTNFRFIVFDAVGTTIAFDPEPAVIYQQIGAAYGSGKTVEQLRAEFKAAVTRRYLGDAANKPTNDEFERNRWQSIVSDCFDDLRPNDQGHVFEALWDHFAKAESWRVLPDVESTLESLTDAGFKLVIASNFDSRLHGVVEGLGLTHWLNPILVNSELGWSKPNPEFYHAAAKVLNASSADQLMMVGDTYGGDYESAIQAGWQARFLDRAGDVSLHELLSDLF